MIKLYRLNRYSVWTGETKQIEKGQGWDKQEWTKSAPPELDEGQYAQLRGTNWFVMDEPLNIHDQKREADRLFEGVIKKLVDDYSQALADIDSKYPLAEKLGWYRFQKAVEEYSADGTVTRGLEAYCAMTGLEIEEAVQLLAGAIDDYDAAYGAATGKLTRLRKQAKTMKENLMLEELAAIEWEGGTDEP